jgi:uncharacterized protein (TIGR00251 family)
MGLINVKVVPGSSRDRVGGRHGDGIRVQVCAPPEGGRANAAVVQLLAKALALKPQQVRVVKGHTTPRKVIEVLGLDAADVLARLENPSPRPRP